jgi:hypothetical protein
MNEKQHEIMLDLPADQEFVLLARMALSGLGMIGGLDVGLIDDVRAAADECCDCLMHQSRKAERIKLTAWLDCGRMHCCFKAIRADEAQDGEPGDLEVSRCVLETLMPDVTLEKDACGVGTIGFSLPL